ncbi:MAG: MFS transporter [Acidobacteriota bacterium]
MNRELTLRKKLAWVFLLYFAEGFPYGIVKDVLPVYFREHGLSLAGIGLFSLLGIPWTLKFLWSPLVDRFGEKRHWVTSCLMAMAVLAVLVPFFKPVVMTLSLWIVLLGFTMASATQDIAIDAYTIGLMDRGEEGEANGMRVTAYRIAIIAGGGGIVILSESIRWKYLFLMASIIFCILAFRSWHIPRIIVPVEKRREWLTALRFWLSQPGAMAVLLFVIIYRLADFTIGPMIKPFWLDRGLSAGEIGAVSISLGVVATIAGALLGGHLTTRWGIFHGLWILGFAPALSNLGYAAIAWIDPPAPDIMMTFSSFASSGFIYALKEPARAMIYSASLLESFTAGLGTAVYLSFLMRICQKEFAATQYALLSALFALARDLSGAPSGWSAEILGYSSYFTLTFLLAFPAYLLLPWIRSWIREDR